LGAINQAEFKLSSGNTSIEELQRVKDNLRKLSKQVSTAKLSPVALTTIMRRAARLADHRAILRAEDQARDVGQVEFLSSLIPLAVRALKCQEEHDMHVGVLEHSLPMTALFSTALIGQPLIPEEMDLLADALLRGRIKWKSQQVVMVTNALGKLGALPINGDVRTKIVLPLRMDDFP